MKTLSKISKVLMVSALLSTSAFAQDENRIDELKQEVAALKSQRLQKLDSLEKLEATRWNARYAQQADLKVLTDRSRKLESTYSRMAGDLSRKQEELISAKQVAEDRELRLADHQAKFSGLKVSLKQNVESQSNELSVEFPVKLSERIALYNEALVDLENEKVALATPLKAYFEDQLDRLLLNQSVELSTRASVFGDGVERTVWSLRLGTVYMAEVDKMSNNAQVLFNTGSLQGKKYAWKSKFTNEFVDQLKSSLTGFQQNKPNVLVSLDVLQNGKLGAGILQEEEKTFFGSIKEWFAKGGLVMYPLLLTALIALLFALERLFKYVGRDKKINASREKLLPLIHAGNYDEALAYCKVNPIGMNNAIASLLENKSGTRKDAEQNIKQILLREIPNLEKRLSLIAALGAAAPLMGLLGTVSGMITLFKVITDVGTNDARILAGGISEALVTTQTGLIIAIPILLIHGFLSEKLDTVVSKINESVLEVMNDLWKEDRA